MIGEKEKLTFPVPNLWKRNRMNKIITDIRTTWSAPSKMKKKKKISNSIIKWWDEDLFTIQASDRFTLRDLGGPWLDSLGCWKNCTICGSRLEIPLQIINRRCWVFIFQVTEIFVLLLLSKTFVLLIYSQAITCQ